MKDVGMGCLIVWGIPLALILAFWGIGSVVTGMNERTPDQTTVVIDEPSPSVRPYEPPVGPVNIPSPNPDNDYVPSAPSEEQDGDVVLCEDGTISDSGGAQGACSWHGGLAD
jgi:hypothetical protein